MGITSNGWIILDDPLDGTYAESLLGAVVADVNRPLRMYKPQNVAKELPPQCRAIPTSYSGVAQELKIHNSTEVKAKLGNVFGAYFNESEDSLRQLKTRGVMHYRLQQLDDWFVRLASSVHPYKQQIEDMMDDQYERRSQLYLITDIKVCQDAVIVNKDVAAKEMGGKITIPIKEIVGTPVPFDIDIYLSSDGKYTVQNDDTFVANGSCVYAIQVDIVRRSWFGDWKHKHMNSPASFMSGGNEGPGAETLPSEFERHKGNSSMAEAKLREAFPDITFATLSSSD